MRDTAGALLDRPTISFADACRLLGIGLTAARAALKRGEFPVPVVRVGRVIRVPSAPLAQLLGLGS